MIHIFILNAVTILILNIIFFRLCDISNIIGKRKLGDLQTRSNSKKVKKSLVSEKGTSDSESLSDYSHSDSNNSLHDNSTFPTNFNAFLDQKLDDLLANEIFNVLKNDSSGESTDVDSDDSNKTSKKDYNGDKGKTDIRKKVTIRLFKNFTRIYECY